MTNLVANVVVNRFVSAGTKREQRNLAYLDMYDVTE